MNTILTLTMNPALDMFLEVGRMKPNGKMRSPQPLFMPGGGGINVSRAIRRLGGESIAMFPAGGSTGHDLARLLDRESISTNVIRIADVTRENVNVLERETGLEYRFIVPGPDVGMDEWKLVLRAIRSLEPAPKYVVASGTLPRGVPVDFYARLASLALERDFRLVIDTSGEPLTHAATKGTFLLKPNVDELNGAVRGLILSDMAISAAAAALVESGRSEVVVVSLGSSGAIVADRSGSRRIPAPVVRIASRVGAGDSMVAGIVSALSLGWNIDDAVMFGVAAGAAAVMTQRHQLCRLEDTEQLYKTVRELCRGDTKESEHVQLAPA